MVFRKQSLKNITSPKNIYPAVSIEKVVLENGATILFDFGASTNTVCHSVTIKGGPRDEDLLYSGITHLIEHLLFKKTKTRSMYELACLIDELGGDINAYTDVDTLCLHGAIPANEVLRLIDLFGDLLLESDIGSEEIETEKDIVRQEILGAQDDVDHVVHTAFCEELWPNSSLGYSVCGTVDSIKNISDTEVRRRLGELLCGSRFTFGFAGPVDRDEIVRAISARFSKLCSGSVPKYETPRCSSGIKLIKHPSSQIHIALGQQWPGIAEDDYLIGGLLSTVVGEGNSSRLFQKLREQKGLAYDISTSIEGYQDTSAFVVCASVEPHKCSEALELIVSEIKTIIKEGVSSAELSRAKNLLVAQLQMEYDHVGERLSRLVDSELIYGRYFSAGEVLERVATVTCDDVTAFIGKWLSNKSRLLVLGGHVDGYVVPEQVREFCLGSAD